MSKHFTYSKQNDLKLSHNMTPSSFYPTHPLVSLSVHNAHRCDGGQCAQTPLPTSNQRSTKKEGGKKFFFCPPCLFWRSFSLYRITHYTTMFFLIQHASFQKNNIIKTLSFLTPSFSVLFSRFFGRFLCFFWTTSISFPFECAFLFPSLIRLFILYQIQYRTTP